MIEHPALWIAADYVGSWSQPLTRQTIIMPHTTTHGPGLPPVAEQVSLLALLEEAVGLGARLAAYGEPRAAIAGHVLSLLPRARQAAPSIFNPAAPTRRLGIEALGAAFEAGYDEVGARGASRPAPAHRLLEPDWIADSARTICGTLAQAAPASAAAMS